MDKPVRYANRSAIVDTITWNDSSKEWIIELNSPHSFGNFTSIRIDSKMFGAQELRKRIYDGSAIINPIIKEGYLLEMDSF